jgi:hypothetical protein
VLGRHGNAEEAGAGEKIEARFGRFRRDLALPGKGENAAEGAGDRDGLILRGDDRGGPRRSFRCV